MYIQYSIHPTGSRRPKTALLAVSRSMHWLCLHPHPPFASHTHSRTHSLTRSIVTQQRIINRPGVQPTPGARTVSQGQRGKEKRSGEESERGREREAQAKCGPGLGDVWLVHRMQPASQPAGRSLSCQRSSRRTRMYVGCMYVCMDVWMYVTRPISV